MAGSQLSIGSLMERPIIACRIIGLSSRHLQGVCNLNADYSSCSIFNWAFTFHTSDFPSLVLRMSFDTVQYNENEGPPTIYSQYLDPVFLVSRKFLHPDLPSLDFKVLGEAKDFEDIEGIIKFDKIPASFLDRDESLSSQVVALCFVHLVPSGCFDLPAFPNPRNSYSNLGECSPQTAYLILNLKSRCIEESCHFALLSDGTQFILVNYQYISAGGIKPEKHLPIFAGFHTDIPVRWLLAQCIWTEAKTLGLLKQWPRDEELCCQGCLNDSHLPKLVSSDLLQSCLAFSDFDLYTLQRDYLAWYEFSRWKQNVQLQTKLPRVDDTVSIQVDAFLRENTVWRSSDPNQALPDATYSVVTRSPRPRDSETDKLLRSNITLDFYIKKVMHTGRDQYSQVFAGHLAGSNRLLCMKLFDERLFPIPEYESYFDDSDCSSRLSTLNFAEDLMRREEAVYNDRMRYLQGTLIPHCYGYHRFTLPDGWSVYGLLLEFVDGTPLSEVDLPSRPESFQEDLISRIRHGVRALCYAGVDQTDWHGDQILCIPSGDTFEIVFIDFAFACQRLGDHWGRFPVIRNVGELGLLIMSAVGLEKSAWWPSPADEEL